MAQRAAGLEYAITEVQCARDIHLRSAHVELVGVAEIDARALLVAGRFEVVALAPYEGVRAQVHAERGALRMRLAPLHAEQRRAAEVFAQRPRLFTAQF